MRTFVKMNFDINVAKEVGADAAIIFENIVYWIAKNRANKKSFHDGDWWTYSSQQAFEQLFPWLSRQNIRTCLKKLKDKGFVKTGNYNKTAYDHTMWYAIGNHMIGGNIKSDWLKSTDQAVETHQPIPNYNKDIKRERGKKNSPSLKLRKTAFDETVESQLFNAVLTEDFIDKFRGFFANREDIIKSARKCFAWYFKEGKAPYNWKGALYYWLSSERWDK